MLTTADLAAMRADLAQLLPDTCSILSDTAAADGQGGMTANWTAVLTNVPCRLDASRLTPDERSIGGALLPFSSWTLTLPYDTAINATQRVTVGAVTYNVVAVDDNKSWPVSLRVILERV